MGVCPPFLQNKWNYILETLTLLLYVLKSHAEKKPENSTSVKDDKVCLTTLDHETHEKETCSIKMR